METAVDVVERYFGVKDAAHDPVAETVRAQRGRRCQELASQPTQVARARPSAEQGLVHNVCATLLRRDPGPANHSRVGASMSCAVAVQLTRFRVERCPRRLRAIGASHLSQIGSGDVARFQQETRILHGQSSMAKASP